MSQPMLAHLPASLTVPPLPPRIHRRLTLTHTVDGLVLRPSPLPGADPSEQSQESVLVRWGVRARVEHSTYADTTATTTAPATATASVEIGGVLGIVRLWDAAYLVVLLPPAKPPRALFPNHVEPAVSDSNGSSGSSHGASGAAQGPAAATRGGTARGREACASAHEVYTLTDVYSVPLVSDLARAELAHLAALNAKRQPRAPKRPTIRRTASKTPLNLKWSLPWSSTPAPPTLSGQAARDLTESITADSSDDDDDDDDDDVHGSGTSEDDGTAPEADETPPALPPPTLATPDSPEARAKKRFSLGWGRFTPRLGKPRHNLATVQGGAETDGGGTTPAAARSGASTPLKLAAATVAAKARKSFEGARKAQESVPEGASDADTGVKNTDTSDVNNPDTTDIKNTGVNSTDAKPTTDPDSVTGSAPTQPLGGDSSPPPVDAPQRHELETKILRQITRELGSGAFFYSFDFDLSHTLQHKRNLLASRSASAPLLDSLLAGRPRATFPPSPDSSTRRILGDGQYTPPRGGPGAGGTRTRGGEDDVVEPDVQVPLWRRFDRRFFWNEWLARDFIDLGLHAYVLPVIQGWVQSASFTVPVPPSPLDPDTPLGSVPVDLVIISRRSRDRAGLRYQRRGIDDEGHVANMVETEMMVRAKVEGKLSLFSFVQVRGSIPLKWSQSPYSMKPPPVLDQPVDQSYSVANLHFDDLKTRYDRITIVNLSEQTGKEGVVTNGYHDLVQSLARPDITYTGFDFHAKCHGMKWENISELVAELDFSTMGYMWTLQGEVIREQNGAFRTNCIDCLDRTNVVQSALARYVLGQMVTQLGLVLDPTTCNVETVFNDMWANNGDMLSFCYAHTSALKGDFVRTGKRDFSGILHDGVSSISRMFYGAISDFFAQAVISFLLGHRNLGVFSEFLETLQSTDASALIKLSRVRAAAIETSSARVLSDGEQRVAGWTLLSPDERNIKLSPKLEEKVLLLTRVAIYVVSFNYSLEKVTGFTRIPLKSITSIQKGAYILSPLQEAGRDPVENSGFVINFSPADESTRYSTYSIRNKARTPPPSPSAAMSRTNPSSATPRTPGTPMAHVEHALVDPNLVEFFAFKALPREFVARGASTTGVALMDSDDADDDDDDCDGDGAYAYDVRDLDVESAETCKATVDRIVRRIKDQCARLGLPPMAADGFVVDKAVVSLAEAQNATSLLTRMDYAVKRFLWL